MENAGKSSEAADRLVAIDYLKGIGVMWFTFGHNMIYWEDHTWRSLFSLLALTMDWTGPGLFIAFTVLGTLISIRRRMVAGNTQGMFKNALVKSSFLLIIGEILNAVINSMNSGSLGIWHIFGANMITDVALAQLLTYGLVKLTMKARSLLLVMLCILYPILLVTCLNGITYDPDAGYIVMTLSDLSKPAYIIYYLLFYLDAMSPTMSWLITAVLASILFELFTNTYTSTSDMSFDIDAQKIQARKLILLGCLAIIIAILAGGFVLFRGLGMSGWEYDFLVTNDPLRFYTLSGLPLILVRHVPQCLIFNAGILVLVFGLLHYNAVVKQKRLIGQTSISHLGKYSFSLFIYGYVFGLVNIKIPFYIFFPLNVAIITAMIVLVNIWDAKAHGIGSIEWFYTKYVMYVSIGLNALKARKKS